MNVSKNIWKTDQLRLNGTFWKSSADRLLSSKHYCWHNFLNSSTFTWGNLNHTHLNTYADRLKCFPRGQRTRSLYIFRRGRNQGSLLCGVESYILLYYSWPSGVICGVNCLYGGIERPWRAQRRKACATDTLSSATNNSFLWERKTVLLFHFNSFMWWQFTKKTPESRTQVINQRLSVVWQSVSLPVAFGMQFSWRYKRQSLHDETDSPFDLVWFRVRCLESVSQFWYKIR